MRFRLFWVTMAVVAIAVLTGIVLGWLGGKETESKIKNSPNPPKVAVVSPASQLPHIENSTGATTAPAPPVATPLQPPPASNPTNVIADWEDKIDQILQAEGPETEKAKAMLQMFPRLPPDGQVEVAQHLSNLVSDEDYASLGKLLTDDKLPEPVLDVLMADVLNRPNSKKLPLLLEVAKDQKHPKAAEARDLLELFLEENYGTNWNQWQTKMEQWLKENPD